MLFPQKPIAEWDLEELEHGRPRNSDGSFGRRAKPPQWLTPVLQIEINKRLKEMTSIRVQSHASRAITTIVELMEMSNVDMVRLQAAQYVLNQIIGMPMQRTEIQAEVDVKTFLADVLVNPDGHDQMVIEGTYEEQEEDDDD